ncbi:MAG: hypothetical protein NT103_08270 [Campylobacterales bacterium]|nr:hypothetical protein [Campylobacterales bacterium]
MGDLEVIKGVWSVAGVGGLFFIAWYIVNKSIVASNERMAEMIKITFEEQASKEQRNFQMQLDAFNRIMNEQSKREERSYELLKDMLETNQCNTGIMARMEHKIDTHHQCPVVRGDLKI